MTKKMVIKDSILIVLTLFYFVYTIRYSITFKKNILFTGYLKTFHLFMIWLVPFIWILMLKSLTKSTPGSHEFENKKTTVSFTEGGLGVWVDSPPND